MTKHFFAKAAAALMVVAASLLGGGTNALHAQNRTISGTVVDTGGQPVIGAAVTVVGNTRIGAATDLNGAFSLSVPAGATMNVESIGYKSQTFTVGTQSTYNIVLEDDTEMLEETVVIGYGVQKKSDLTGSVASVGANDLKNQSTTDAAAALQGKVSGVHIISGAGPGAGAEIRVRGYSSNDRNIGPLLIVDGLQVSSIQYLDPSMIESIEVLKDAASAAIYGAQAGNGVVLVTTKSGQDGRSNVTYTAKATLQNYTKRPMMRRDDFIKYARLAQGDDNWIDASLSDFDYKHPYYKDGVIDQDWIDAYIEPTWSQQHSLTFSGGNKNGHFFTSLNYVYNNGVVRGDKDVYNRLSAQINADYQLFKWLQVGTNTSFEKWSTKSVSQRGYASSFDSMLVMDPLTPVYWTSVDEMPGFYRSVYDRVQAGDPTVRPYRFLGDENGWFATTSYSDTEGSPLTRRDLSDASNGGININGTFFVNLTPLKGLTFTSRFGYRINQSVSHNYQAPYYINNRSSSDNYSISANASTGFYYQWENFANYMVNFGKHSITAMAGMSYRENNRDDVSASASGPDILRGYEENFRYLDYVNSLSTTSKSIGNAPSRSASLAYFGRLIYSYDNRYSIQANFRADAFDSSKLSVKNRWGYFPSVSAGWTVSNEPFFRDNLDNRTFNFLKLRASWGRNGNVNVLSGYRYSTTISQGNSWYQFDVDKPGNTYSSSPNGLPNPNLTWETSEQLDLGLDARFLNNRLTFAVDYFNKQTKDLLFSKNVPPELGVTEVTVNGGNVLNEGLEFELGWRDHIGDFNYSISANFSTLHNEVLSLAEGTEFGWAKDAASTNYEIETRFEPGYPVWYMYGYKYAGVSSDGAPLYYNIKGDVVSKGEIGLQDKQYIGQGIPTFTYGLNINLSWKGFDFAMYGAGVGGNSILPVIYRGYKKNTMKYYLKAYENGKYPHPSYTAGDYECFWSSSANLFKGDFFRIKQLQLGYTLPAQLTRKAAISNLRFYVSLDDFFTFTSYPGLDPETASINSSTGSGLDWGSYPTMQKLVLGVNLTF